MFFLHQSNQLDLLKSLMAEMIRRQPLRQPLQAETIIVQSTGMAQWLQINLAQQLGIAANIQFPLPARFIGQMFSLLLPEWQRPDKWQPALLQWQLMRLLPDYLQEPVFSELADYLADDPQQTKLQQLSQAIASLFDHYLVYRPGWLSQWEQGKLVAQLGDQQAWQARLWQLIVVEQHTASLTIPYRAEVYQQFIDRLQQSQQPPAGLPERIFLCGISALPPLYLQALAALSQHCDVHLFFMDPCQEYWGDAVNNPLLAAWGKLGRDYLQCLQQIPQIQRIDAFVEVTEQSLLASLQADILYDRHLAEQAPLANSQKRQVAATDHSIALHCCHSPLREVEVLHDQLLQMMNDDPQLQPRDIIVMVADIEQYVPFIQAVFANAPTDRYLPFAISDRRARQAHPIVQAFLNLLRLPDSRFTSEEVLLWLEVPAIAERFAIDQAGLATLRRWIEQTGICWGLDDDTLRQQQLPVTGQYTWQFGWQRMLLGYAMSSEQGSWQGILPYDGSAGLAAQLVGQLGCFIRQLQRWRAKLSQAVTAEVWLDYGHELLMDFFAVNPQSETALTLIEQQWLQRVNTIIDSQYQAPISAHLLHVELQQSFDKLQLSQRFLAGMVNFCTLLPMRSIPFKVVCLLGMNDGVYPRLAIAPSFDLMAKHWQLGDRSRRDDDRYLFLEAMLSAQQRLYISYVGYTLQDNQPCYPSILLQELMDYLDGQFISEQDAAIPISQQLSLTHARMPFSAENFQANRQQSFANEWLAAARGQGELNQAFAQPLPTEPLTDLSLSQLLAFYRHPVRYYFQRRLSVYFEQGLTPIANHEPFALTPLQRYQMNQQLLTALIEQGDAEACFTQLRQSGTLPYGPLAENEYQQQIVRLRPLAERITHNQQHQYQQEVNLNLAACSLTGWLTVQASGLLRYHPAVLTLKQGLALWLEHLAYCAMGGQGTSHYYGLDDSHWQFAPLAAKQAKQQLVSYITGYQQGQIQPLLLAHRSAQAWLSQCYQLDSGQLDDALRPAARQKWLAVWHGGYQQRADSGDLYWQRLALTIDEANWIRIEQAISDYLLPVWHANQQALRAQESLS